MPEDHVDRIVQQWNAERPEVDVSPMAVIGRLSRLTDEIRPKVAATFAQHDLEPWEFDVLATLLRSGAPYMLTPGELLGSMMVSSGAMTNRIDRLESRGFVKREKSPTDGRQVLVKLTKKGADKVDRALIDHMANERSIVSSLSANEQAQLIKLLKKLGAELAN